MAKRKKPKQKDFMNKNASWKWFVAPCVLIIICSCVYMIWFINNRNSTYTNIEYIKGFMTSSGTLNDFSNKIAMHDPKTDIKWFMTGDEVRIEFGRIVMDWSKEDFFKEENLRTLAPLV